MTFSSYFEPLACFQLKFDFGLRSSQNRGEIQL